MAKVNPHNLTGTIQGKIGGLVFAQCQDGRVLVRQAPQRSAKFTARERANQSRFARAVAYLRRLKACPNEYTDYQRAALIHHRRACDLAIADFLRPPRILEIDLTGYSGAKGQTIPVQATDDFEVVELLVSISDLAGRVYEEGPATRQTSEFWVYTAQTTVPAGQTVLVRVTARDRAGNRVEKAAVAIAGLGVARTGGATRE
jgi:hypothetical protein